MPSPINLSPSTDENALVAAMLLASNENRTLNLLPGIHLTKRGRGKNHRIRIGANGLKMKGGNLDTAAASVKRPDFSIPIGSVAEGNYGLGADDNYSLYCIPEAATPADFAEVNSWQEYTDEENHTFQYAVILRGSIEIENIIVDCNMGNQNLHALYENPPANSNRPAEHSCMLGFSGTFTEGSGVHTGKRIYLGFKEVIIKNIITQNGGFADDIWISRGYFNPNIKRVSITNIISVNRVDPHRGTICFSGLAQNVEIENANVYRLECEETSSKWDELPRKSGVYTPSQWNLKSITAQIIDIAAKGKSIWMNATDLYAASSFNVYQVGGTINNSLLNKGTESRLIRLNNLIFTNVTWILTARETGEMFGLRPAAQYGEICEVAFIDNDFKVNGAFSTGSLISSEYSRALPENMVVVKLSGCTYDSRFGSPAFPNTFVISALERGSWKIKKSDFGNRSIDRALRVNPQLTDVNIQLM